MKEEEITGYLKDAYFFNGCDNNVRINGTLIKYKKGRFEDKLSVTTSPIVKIETIDSRLIIHTRNSIYQIIPDHERTIDDYFTSFDKVKRIIEASMGSKEKFRYRLFIDDERWPSYPDWVIARTPLQAIEALEHYGFPYEMGLDHDLGSTTDGTELTTMEFINYLWKLAEEGTLVIPKDFKYSVHSQNPIGAENIRSKMDQLIRYFTEE